MISSRVCISDADVLIKICNSGHLEILSLLFEQVIIPAKVYEEVLRKLRRYRSHLTQAIDKQLIKIISFSQLKPIQRQGIESFLESYRDSMDDGELHATALANEFSIDLMLIDDRNAIRLIKNCTEIICVTHWEYIHLCIASNKLAFEDGQAIFESINSTVTHPIGIPFAELMKRAAEKFKD